MEKKNDDVRNFTYFERGSLRLIDAFCIFVYFGLVGVLVDLDHIICGLQNKIPLWPIQNLYGCKLWHDALGPVGWGLLGLALSLLLGCILVISYAPTKRTFKPDNAMSRTKERDTGVKANPSIQIDQTDPTIKASDVRKRVREIERKRNTALRIPGKFRNQILTGDCRELSREIPSGSIDLIFTDPPYPERYLYLYEWLAGEAARLLKPEGFLLVYTPSASMDFIMAMMRKKLEHYTLCVVSTQGNASVLWNLKMLARAKFINVYVPKGSKAKSRSMFHNLFKGTGLEKSHHKWQQGLSEARYYIDCFSSVGDFVFDPFMGGGTTGVACVELERHYIGFEVDFVHSLDAETRINERKNLL